MMCDESDAAWIREQVDQIFAATAAERVALVGGAGERPGVAQLPARHGADRAKASPRLRAVPPWLKFTARSKGVSSSDDSGHWGLAERVTGETDPQAGRRPYGNLYRTLPEARGGWGLS